MELLESAGSVRARRMFGGWGFYVDDLFVALLADNRLYLKVNLHTHPTFEAAGGQAFVYAGKHQTVQLAYCTPPDEALEAPALMRPWVALALQAAMAARSLKRGGGTRLPPTAASPAAAVTPTRRGAARLRSNNSR